MSIIIETDEENINAIEEYNSWKKTINSKVIEKAMQSSYTNVKLMELKQNTSDSNYVYDPENPNDYFKVKIN